MEESSLLLAMVVTTGYTPIRADLRTSDRETQKQPQTKEWSIRRS